MSIGAELVSDPVSHISISGVHGRKALDERLASVTPQAPPRDVESLAPLVAGALLGAALMFLLSPRRGS